MTLAHLIPEPPIRLDTMVDDVDALVAMVRCAAPIPPLQRGLYRTAAELAAMGNNPALGDADPERPPPARSSFRRFFARNGEVMVDGAQSLLHSERFIAAALALHDGVEVRPMEVYVNVNVPEREQRSAHTDVPDFRGLSRRQLNTGVLTTMRRSGLYSRWQIATAAMVGWLYEGRGGAYTYWPDGPAQTPVTTAQPFSNTAIVGENDIMFHRGEPVIGPDGTQPGVPGMTVSADLIAAHLGWDVVDNGRVLASFAGDEVRYCVSWTAEVVRSDEERRLIDEHLDDLTVELVDQVFRADLAGRGTPVPPDVDLLEDPRGLALLAGAYSMTPVESTTAPEVHR